MIILCHSLFGMKRVWLWQWPGDVCTMDRASHTQIDPLPHIVYSVLSDSLTRTSRQGASVERRLTRHFEPQESES